MHPITSPSCVTSTASSTRKTRCFNVIYTNYDSLTLYHISQLKHRTLVITCLIYGRYKLHPTNVCIFVMKDIDHYRTLAEANARQTREEALVFMGEHTQNLILGKPVQVQHVITDLFYQEYGSPLFRDHCPADQGLRAGGRVTVTSEEQENINIFLL